MSCDKISCEKNCLCCIILESISLLFSFNLLNHIYFPGFLYVNRDKHVELLSIVISRLLEISCYVLMGANITSEVAARTFCEATVRSRNYEYG